MGNTNNRERLLEDIIRILSRATFEQLRKVYIQKRYFEAVSRRKNLEVDYNILLVDPTQICKDVNISAKNVNISPENAAITVKKHAIVLCAVVYLRIFHLHDGFTRG